MAGTVATDNSIDVICQHTRTGDTIPLRIRLIDEDGIYQTFVQSKGNACNASLCCS